MDLFDPSADCYFVEERTLTEENSELANDV
jgi:hypothetical protein